ncbi:hypothetical protein GKD75_21545 [Odoribacter splanchnicus]|nr:hypothetical protein [Odoribacter splanchnicus]
MTNRGACGTMIAALLYQWRLATSLRGEVMRMGDGRWARALRCVVVFLAVLWLLVYIGPNAC